MKETDLLDRMNDGKSLDIGFRFVAIKGIINYTIARHMTIDFRKKPGTRKDCHLNW